MTDTDEVMHNEVAEAAGVPQEQPGTASMSFVVAIGEQPVPALRLSAFGGDPSWFVQAKHPRGDESKIRKAATSMSVVAGDMAAADDDDDDDEREVRVSVDPDASFLNKCLHQITDFQLPTSEGVRNFDHSRGGTLKNREVYEAILYSRDQAFRKVLEEYLDWVAGRAHKALHDFEALGNAPG